jgi:hypothetical protein
MTLLAASAVRIRLPIWDFSCFAKYSEVNFTVALLTPMSKKARYPTTTHAIENKPKEVSPKNDTSFGMATISTRKIHPSVTRLKVALRASRDDDVSREAPKPMLAISGVFLEIRTLSGCGCLVA